MNSRHRHILAFSGRTLHPGRRLLPEANKLASSQICSFKLEITSSRSVVGVSKAAANKAPLHLHGARLELATCFRLRIIRASNFSVLWRA